MEDWQFAKYVILLKYRDYYYYYYYNALGAFTFLSINCVLWNLFSCNLWTTYLDDCAMIPNMQ